MMSDIRHAPCIVFSIVISWFGLVWFGLLLHLKIADFNHALEDFNLEHFNLVLVFVFAHI